MNETEEKIWEMAAPYLSVMDNDVHTRGVVDFAHRLLLSENGDRSVVIPAAILHDVGWSQLSADAHEKARIPNGNDELVRLHEKAGVEIARKILTAVGYDRLETEEILMIIDGHDTGEAAESVNDKIIRDADKLSRFSFYFWTMYKRFGNQIDLDLNGIFAGLESRIEQWFYFSKSKEIARQELVKRRQEIGKEEFNTPIRQ